MNDLDRERRELWCQHWQEFSRLHAHYEANDVDYRQREYPPFPEEARGLTCGAKSKRTGQPCCYDPRYFRLGVPTYLSETSAFAQQAECSNLAAFGLPAQRLKHGDGVKGALRRASPALDPAPVLRYTPQFTCPDLLLPLGTARQPHPITVAPRAVGTHPTHVAQGNNSPNTLDDLGTKHPCCSSNTDGHNTCKQRAISCSNGRCKFHGGASIGPTTKAGK